MSATITKGYTFGATETVTNTKLHSLVDSATVTNIVDADISAGANIDASKIDLSSSGYLTTGQATASITGNWTYTGNVVTGDLIASLLSIGTAQIESMQIASLASIADLRTDYADIASLASLANINVVNINGSAYSSGSAKIQTYTSSGTFTVPSGVETIFVTVVGAGAGGGAGKSNDGGGGGGAGAYVVDAPVRVVPGATYNYTVGSGGTGGTTGNDDATGGGNSTFVSPDYTITCAGGSKGTAVSGTGGVGGSGGASVSAGTLHGVNNGSGSPTSSPSAVLEGGIGGDGGSGLNGGGGGGTLLGKGGNGTSTTGTDGSGYGAGGGGGKSAGGGNGSDGVVIIKY